MLLPMFLAGIRVGRRLQFLKKDDRKSLRFRTGLAQWLKKHPVNREPPFQPGQAGLKLSWESVPEPRSIFRYLYE